MKSHTEDQEFKWNHVPKQEFLIVSKDYPPIECMKTAVISFENAKIARNRDIVALFRDGKLASRSIVSATDNDELTLTPFTTDQPVHFGLKKGDVFYFLGNMIRK